MAEVARPGCVSDEEVNDAERWWRDPAMRRVCRRQRSAAKWAASRRSDSQHVRTSLLLPNCAADGSNSCTAEAAPRHPARHGSSVSPPQGEQEDSVWSGHHAYTCYHPLFMFNQFGNLE